MDEFALIERFFAPLCTARDDVRLGVGDDVAVVDAGPGLLGLAVDTLVAGVHFPEDLPAEHVGYRAVAVNVSDFAAMAATPRFATLALTLPDADSAWLERFASGMGEALKEYGIALVGGDTTRGPLTITVQLTGTFDVGPLRRDGAQPGDLVVVSGTPGDAARGLELMRAPGDPRPEAAYLRKRFERPAARLALARVLHPWARAGIDVSDGLVADVGHLASRSGCGAILDLEQLPVSAELERSCGRARALELAAVGGDDYELALAIRPADLDVVHAAALATGVPVSVVGTFQAGAGVRLQDADGRETKVGAGGYRHFS